MERDIVALERHIYRLRFQLTRSRGAWPYGVFCIGTNADNFNSHAHVERDTDCRLHFLCFFISTHTLTWSVTYKDSITWKRTLFQLTRSRGAWQPPAGVILYPWHFNSHAHVERDAQRRRLAARPSVFQLTRSRGAWPADVSSRRTSAYISTHTLTWSVTLTATTASCFFTISTHTLTWSVTIL